MYWQSAWDITLVCTPSASGLLKAVDNFIHFVCATLSTMEPGDKENDHSPKLVHISCTIGAIDPCHGHDEPSTTYHIE